MAIFTRLRAGKRTKIVSGSYFCPRGHLSARQSAHMETRPMFISVKRFLQNRRRFCLLVCISVSFGGATKAVGPFYMVSKPGEVKHPTQGVGTCNLSWTPYSSLQKDNSLNPLLC